MKKQREEITIKDLFNIFVPKIWIIALVTIVCAAVLGGYTMFIKEDTYTSKAKFIMVKIPTQYAEDSGTTSAVTTGLNAQEIEAMQQMISMSEQVMETDDYLITVKEALVAKDEKYKSVSLGQLRQFLSIKIVGEATVFDLSAVTNDAQLSYDILDVVYHTLPSVIGETFKSYSIEIKVIDSPDKATSADGKGVLKNTVIGGLAGVVLSMLAVFIISKLDVVVRSKEKLEQSFDIPIIGMIPRFDDEV